MVQPEAAVPHAHIKRRARFLLPLLRHCSLPCSVLCRARDSETGEICALKRVRCCGAAAGWLQSAGRTARRRCMAWPLPSLLSLQINLRFCALQPTYAAPAAPAFSCPWPAPPSHKRLSSLPSRPRLHPPCVLRTLCPLCLQVKLEKERDGFPLTSIREINILLR